MEPGLREGDRLLVRWGRAPREGDVVLARFVDGTLAVKRAAERRTT
jgi:phage repressor protein C with HTH and peptisase S24 domain